MSILDRYSRRVHHVSPLPRDPYDGPGPDTFPCDVPELRHPGRGFEAFPANYFDEPPMADDNEDPAEDEAFRMGLLGRTSREWGHRAEGE